MPFDLKHIRVIYYDVTDPFWGTKLLDKVAENILSAIQNPEEAVFKGDEDEARSWTELKGRQNNHRHVGVREPTSV